MDFRIQQFIEMWKSYYQTNGIDIQLLFPMLSHIYGEDSAKHIFFQNGLEWFIK